MGTQGSKPATSMQGWADFEYTHKSKCPDLLGGFFTHWSCRKAMQTQKNSLPTPTVAFYRKMLKAVASVIFDTPWIVILSETWSAERFCRNTNRYNRQRCKTRCFLSGHLSLHVCFHGMHYQKENEFIWLNFAFCVLFVYICFHLSCHQCISTSLANAQPFIGINVTWIFFLVVLVSFQSHCSRRHARFTNMVYSGIFYI